MEHSYSETMPEQSTSNHLSTFATSTLEPHVHMLLKPKTPIRYAGQRDYNTMETWISSVNSYLILSQARPPYIYYALIPLLEGEAAIWFRYHFPETCASTLTWEVVRDALRLYFAPANKLQRLNDEWLNIRQTSSVPEYAARYSAVAMELTSSGQPIPDSMLVHNYIRGLKPRTRLEVQLRDPKTLSEAIAYSDRFDQIAFSRFNKSDRYEYNGRSSYVSGQYESNGEPMQIDTLAINELEIDALRSKTFKTPKLQKLSLEERSHLRKLGACFKCRQPGHMARECPTNLQQLSPSKNSTRQ
jgi:Ty3 transposon capsid-like protein/Zinc knuckle